MLEAKVTRPCEVIPDYPADLERIVMKALERMPERRYQTARELQMDLEGFARNQKLEVSSAALAEWMEAAFGPKQEIWHTLPLPPSDSNDESGPPAPEADGRDPQGQSRSTSRRDAGRDAAAARPRRCWSTAIAMLTHPRSSVAPRSPGALARRARMSSRAAAAAGNQAVLLVAENGSVAHRAARPAPAPVVTAMAPAAPAPVEAAPTAREAPAASSRRAHAGRPQRASGAEALSAAVAVRSAEIRRCFTESDAPAASTGEISLRFEVGVDGTSRRSPVLPSTVGATPLGHAWRRSASTTVVRDAGPRRSRFESL